MIKDIHPDKEGLTEQVENAPPARTETHHVSKVTAKLIKPVLGRSHGLATRLQQSPNLFHNLALLLPSRNLTLDPQSQLIRPSNRIPRHVFGIANHRGQEHSSLEAGHGHV